MIDRIQLAYAHVISRVFGSVCVQVVALSSDWLVWLRLSAVIGWSNLNNINQSRPFLSLSQLILSVFNGEKT